MNDQRLPDVLRLCQDALALEAGERGAYLDAACGGDFDLRREVEALLRDHEAGGPSLLDTPAWPPPLPTLTIGQRLGPYEVIEKIGSGGMGAVYRARDTRLDRTVAIKVLAPDVSADPERRARFEREAKTIACLNHAHICVLHDVGDHEGRMFLVMEHLAGQTLAERLEKGALPLEQTLTVATEIADALSAAHRQGVVHRDLKPANVMLTKSGAKLLDFGLAKLRTISAPVGVPATGPAMTGPLTSPGLILGTVPYMAPEQLAGQDADARSDIFSLGAVLYEMLTGQRAFQGDNQAALIVAIMSSQPPPVSSLQPLTPPALDRLVRKCLRKDVDARWQTAPDVADELRWVAAGGGPASAAPAPATYPGGGRATGSSKKRQRSTFLAIPVAASNLALTGVGVAISPDGRVTAFAANRPGGAPQLFVRRLEDREPQALKDTEGALLPFFSPDGEQVAFFRGGQVMRVALDDGRPQPVITDPDWLAGEMDFGGTWGPNGRIFFGGGYIRPGIWHVPAEGGRPEVFLKGEGEAFYNFPDLLPDNRSLLFTLYKGGRSSVNAWRPDLGAPREVIRNASRARYLPSGHLLYEEGGSLRVVRFNCDSLQADGEPRIVVDDVGNGGGLASLAATWDVSRGNVLIFTPPYLGLRRLVWRDRQGRTTDLPLRQRAYLGLALSPDNERLVVGVGDGLRRSLWWGRLDAEPLQPLTYGYDDVFQTFSPDGRWVAFTRHEKGHYGVFRTAADGSGAVEQLTDGDRPQGLPAFSPDGKVLLFNTPEPTGDFHIWQKRLDPPGPAGPFIYTPTVRAETNAAFSPDGQWVAYVSDASGTFEVWVQQYPEGERVQVSTGGGLSPAWNPAADELVYLAPASLMSVRFVNRRPGRPEALFPVRRESPGGYIAYQLAVSRDGERFLVFEGVESATQPSLIYVVSNWFEGLRVRVPSAR